MNPRIKQLAEQTIGANPKYAVAMIMASPELEKFAELIVRECADEAIRLGTLNPDVEFKTGSLLVSECIKMRFGVEE